MTMLTRALARIEKGAYARALHTWIRAVTAEKAADQELRMAQQRAVTMLNRAMMRLQRGAAAVAFHWWVRVGVDRKSREEQERRAAELSAERQSECQRRQANAVTMLARALTRLQRGAALLHALHRAAGK